MLTDLNEKQTKTTRYISRYLPVEKACHADIADITIAAKSIFEPHFSQKDSEGNIIPKKVNQSKCNQVIVCTNFPIASLLLHVECVIAQNLIVWMSLIHWLQQLAKVIRWICKIPS